VAISPALKEVVARRLEDIESNDCLFTNEGEKYYPAVVSHTMARCCRKAGIAHGHNLFDEDSMRIGITLHCFKVTRVTKWAEQGHTEAKISMARGTATAQILQAGIK
jgi:hypothetical protein